MSVVQIGGQNFVLQGLNSQGLTNIGAAGVRGAAFYSRLLIQSARPIELINLDEVAIRSTRYANIPVIAMGPFRPRTRPLAGYVYPRRIS